MTEAEWLACEEPQALIEFVSRDMGERRCRLLAVALCRHVLPLVGPECGHRAVDTAEAYADGFATAGDMRAARERASDAYCTFLDPAPVNTEAPLAVKAASIALQATMFAASEFDHYLVSCFLCTEKASVRRWMLQARPDELRPPYSVLMSWQLALVRDIFGNPFRRVAFSPKWASATAVALARQMYESRDFSAMPILADAIQDTGCDAEQLLGHCRGPGPHVRGCRVVDLVLGKG
ncbi:MAG TPA: hypothetical protein VHR66_16560 [Gemmataceae bacterium]|nr:hypothetical protein [Gemmataceae bacterium]